VRRSFILLLFIVSAASQLLAQVYPVQATVQLTPPYSLYLSDYTQSGTERLAVNVFLADIARPSLDVRFRLKIIGQGISIETKAEYIAAPVTIHGGIPLRLISTDLTEYFNANNLNFSGISRREYEQRGKLPEGVYQFCFEVLEYNRGLKISNTACATAWMILNDPPMINLPQQNEKLKAQSPQNVVLQWTPRHTGSPNSAFTTQYDVTMVEVWPSTRNPNDAILTSPPIFETTTSSTTVVYGPSETPLEPGRRYAFRVRAKSIAGIDELDLFKNNGYSEVFTFVYGDACDLPTGITAGTVNATRFNLAWDGTANQTAYRVRYREAGTVNWYENSASITSADIISLKPATVYEYQVAATCGFFDGQYSPVARVTTQPTPETSYSCGVPMGTFTIDPAQLVGSLKVGDIINAGDFDVVLTSVSGSNGVFTGEGVIEVPYFNKAKVKASFSSISVNKDLRMVNGFMNVTGAAVDVIPSGVLNAMDGLTEALNGIDSALTTIEENLPEQFDPNSFVADTLINVKDGIRSVYKDDGSVVVVDKNGVRQTIPAGTSAAVVDSSGKGYLVDSKGNIHETTSAIAAKAGNRELNLLLNFTAAANMKYGFDTNRYPPLANDYEKLKGNYNVAWKSVASGEQDAVTATLANSSGIDKSKIRFEKGGLAIEAAPMGSSQSTTVPVTGTTDGIEEGLLAVYTPSDTSKEQVLGKLNVVTYSKISHSVVIVPVNDVALPSGLTDQDIQKSLNDIYGQAVADWTVSIAQPITVPGLGDPFDEGDSGLLSNYTGDMKEVIKAYGSLQDEKLYLFLVKHPKNITTLGYMPRGKQAGFIFVDKHGSDTEALKRTMAHELGHGAFSLHHTFKEPNFTLNTGDTDNLMDYPNGNKLYKYQWDKMRYPDIVVGLFEEDEEGENATVINLEGLSEFANKDANGRIVSYTFLARSGKPISLPVTLSSVTFSTGDAASCSDNKFRVSPFGTISKFKIKNEKGEEKEFAAYWVCGTSQFTSYQSGSEIYYDILTNSSIKKAIIGLPAVSGNKLTFKVGQIDIGAVTPTDKYTAAGPYQPYDFLVEKVKTISKYNEVFASFSPDYDTDVRQFIIDNIGKDGFDGTKFYDNDIYVFTHATQLQTYNILEGCFRTGVPGELLKFITQHVTYYNTTMYGITTSTSTDAMVFSSSYEENPAKKDAKSLINHWQKYDLNYYPTIAKAVANFSIPKKTTANEVYEILKPVSGSINSDNWNCFWEKIGVEKRIELIRELIPQNSAGDMTEEMVLLLITTAHGSQNQLALIDSLQASNYSLFRTVWDVLDNNERLKLSYVLTDWLRKYKSPGANYADAEFTNFVNAPESNSDGTNDNFFILFRQNWLDDIFTPFEVNFTKSNNLYIKYSFDPNSSPSKPDYFDWTGAPFDWVALRVMNDFPNYGLKEGDLMAVPAVFLFGLDNDIDHAQNLATLRVLGDAVAIALAPVTAGGSTVIFAIEVTAASVDIIVTTNRAELDSYLGEEAGVIWDVMYGGWNLFTLGRSFFVPTTKIVDGVERVSRFSIMMQRADEVANTIATYGNTTEKLAYIARLEELLNVLKTQKFNNVAKAAEMFSKVLELKLKIERTLKVTETIIDITVKDGNLVVKGTLSLGKIDFVGDVPTLTQNIRWLPESIKNVKLVDQFNNVATVVNGNTSIGLISVVEDVANAGQFYLTTKMPLALGSGGTGTFANYPKITSWLNTLTNVTSKTGIETVIKNWDSKLLIALNQALGKYSGLGAELAVDTKLLNYFEGVNQNWWCKYGLLRDHYRTGKGSITLPNNFKNIVESLFNRTGTTTIGSRLAGVTKPIDHLGDMLEEDVVPLILEGFRTGNFVDMPQGLIQDLTMLRNEGYKIIITQPKIRSVNFIGEPELDMLLFKYDDIANTIEFGDALYLDCKLYAGAEFDGPQLAFAKTGRGKASEVFKFVTHQNISPQLIVPSGVNLPFTSIDQIIGQTFTLTKTAKIGTDLKDQTYIIMFKNYNPK